MENLKSWFRAIHYDRQSAVQYATRYALVPNKKYKYFGVNQRIGGDCTNFVSQCLKAGGIPFSYDKKNPWWYNFEASTNVCSLSWSVAHSLFLHLRKSADNNTKGAKALQTNNVSDLELGDLIFYENKSGVIFHSTIITAFSGIPLVSQHSVEALNVSYIKPYYVAKTHFVKIYT